MSLDKFERIRRAHQSEIAEDYVEMISDLIAETGEARAVDLASRFGVTSPTVNATIQRLQKEFDITQEDLGVSLGKSRTAISNSLRLLQLTSPVQAMLESGSLSMGHARPLLTLPEAIQEKFALKIVKSGMSARQAENLAKTYQKEKGAKVKSAKDPNLVNLETELGDVLGAKVAIAHQKKGSGKITFFYKDLDQLDQIIGPLRKKE